MKHLDLKKLHKLTPYQKVAIGTWKEAKDPSIYAEEDLDYTPVQAFSEKIFKEQGIRLTPTYIIAQTVSLIFTVRPQLNTILRGNMLYQRKNLSLSCLVSVDEEDQDISNLSSCVVHNTSQLNIIELYKILKQKVEQTKNNQDEVVQAQNRLLGKIPAVLMKYVLNTLSFILYTLNLKFKGMPQDPFGSVMISNLGQMGIDKAFIPLVYYSRVPVAIGIGLVKPRPFVLPDGTVTAKDMIRLNCTIDHRYIDGKSLSIMRKMLVYILSKPEKWLLPSPISIKEEFIKSFYAL